MSKGRRLTAAWAGAARRSDSRQPEHQPATRNTAAVRKITEGVGERPGLERAADLLPAARCGLSSTLCPSPPPRNGGDEARTLVSPTPSVVNQSRHRQSAI